MPETTFRRWGVGIRMSYVKAGDTYYLNGTVFSSWTVTASSWMVTSGNNSTGTVIDNWDYHIPPANIIWPNDASYLMRLEVLATDYAMLEDGTGSGNISVMTTVYFAIDFTTPPRTPCRPPTVSRPASLS
jgi:hypothetical protein